MEFSSGGICEPHVDKALGKLPQLWSQPCFKQEVGLEASGEPPFTFALILWLQNQTGKKCHSSQSLLHSCSLRIPYLQEYFSSTATSVLAGVLYCRQRAWRDLAPFEEDLFTKGHRNRQQQQRDKHALSRAFSYSDSLRLPESPRDPREFNGQEYICAVK